MRRTNQCIVRPLEDGTERWEIVYIGEYPIGDFGSKEEAEAYISTCYESTKKCIEKNIDKVWADIFHQYLEFYDPWITLDMDLGRL